MTINKSFPPRGSFSAEDSSETENNNSSALGFTLVELIVAISIGIVVLTAFSSIFVSSLNNIRAINQTKQLHTNAVYIINTLTYEIKQAKKLEVSGGSILTITQPDGPDANSDDDIIIINADSFNNSDVTIENLNFITMQRSFQINFTIESVAVGKSFTVTTTKSQRN